ncbi:hypothetical protein lpari_03227 [Legionella parisiensis]|uniref:Uncharacterized protein n=1 Tax=Legionella parisiensis TaxID=45071 RepID=A0A1E5JMX0_9GAMM|nr:hypothetical protein lpari_03227 [Legionella parisiensis]STX76274.1 Uncharacterised protein [Legionella parisiensis]
MQNQENHCYNHLYLVALVIIYLLIVNSVKNKATTIHLIYSPKKGMHGP